MSARGSAATRDDSKPSAKLPALRGIAPLVLVLGIAGTVLLCLAETSTVVEIRVGQVVRATESGAEQHSWALLVLAVGALPMTWGAAVGRARPAAFALVAIGVVALAFWGVGDLPDTSEVGQYGVRYEAASAAAGPGFWLELTGGVALLGAGVLTLKGRESATSSR